MNNVMRLVVLWLAVLLCVRAHGQSPQTVKNPPSSVTAALVPMEQWIDRLASADPEVRANAAESLGKLDAKAAPAVKPLVKCLKDRNADVRFYAAWALAHIGADAPRVVPALLSAMNDQDDDVRMQATVSLTAFPQSARQIVPKLIAGMKSSVKYRRYYCVSCVGDFGKAAQEAIPLLVQALTDPQLDIQLYAVNSLKNIGVTSPQVEAALIVALKQDSWLLSGAAASALGEIASPKIAMLSTLADRFINDTHSADINAAVAYARLLSRLPDPLLPKSGEEKRGCCASARPR